MSSRTSAIIKVKTAKAMRVVALLLLVAFIAMPQGLAFASDDLVAGSADFSSGADNGGSSEVEDTAFMTAQSGTPGVSYRTHVQNVGWQGYVSNGAMSGTSGKALRLEGINIRLDNAPYSGGIRYRTHVQNIGWQGYVADGAMSGTSGKALRLEGIQIELTGEMAKHYDVYYRVHAQNVGWMGWAKNGAMAGTAAHAYRLEGINIKLVPKGGVAPGSTSGAFLDASGYSNGAPESEALVLYRTHVQNDGWQPFMRDGEMAGTSGRSLRLEGINIKLGGAVSGGIRYRTHIQNIGWQDWKHDGAMSGTSGRSLRLEAIQIELSGDAAARYDVYYRVHAQNFGWMGWAKNGQHAGTAGYGYRLEGIQIKLVEKGGAAPGATANAFKTSGASGETTTSTSYTVKFSANGGTGSMAAQYMPTSVSTPIRANAFSRAGYTFVGWNTRADGAGRAFADRASVSGLAFGGGTVTLYAQWKADPVQGAPTAKPGTQVTPEPTGTTETPTLVTPKTYSVVFMPNSGYGSMSAQKIETGKATALTANAYHLDGYTFNGWNTQANGKGANYADKAMITDLAAANGSITLYAQWKSNYVAPTTYTVKFDANGGSGYMSNQLMQRDTETSLNRCGYTRGGYTFVGWRATPNGTELPYADTQPVCNLAAAGGSITLYAQWKQNYVAPTTYTVKFYANGGSGNMADQSVAYGSTATLKANAFTRANYTFAGWNTYSNGAGTNYADRGSVYGSSAGGTLILYAQWKANPYTVKFNANGGTGAMTDQFINYGSSATLKANAFTRANYAFAGWNTNSYGTGTSYANMASVKGSTPGGTLTLYAQWAANPYAVKFYANGGVGSMADQSVAYGTVANLKTNAFTRANYTFTGWNTNASGTGTSYADRGSVYGSSAGGSLALYAQWKANPTTVKFNSNGGSGTMADQSVTYGTTANLKANTFTRSGYTFANWNTKADGTGTSYTNTGSVKASTPGGTITLYAQWTAAPTTVVFNANGGSGSMSSQTIAYGKISTLKANTFTRSGYTFKGWNTSSNGTGTSYADKSSIRGRVAGGTMTLYAQWEKAKKNGWVTESGKTRYYVNGTMIAGKLYNVTTSSSGHPAGTRYFNSDGTVYTGWGPSSYPDRWFNPSNDGVMVVNQAFDVPHSGGSNKYYFGSNGVRELNTSHGEWYFRKGDGVGIHYNSDDYVYEVLMAYRNYRLANGLSEPIWHLRYEYLETQAYASNQHCAAVGKLEHSANSRDANICDILQYSTWVKTPDELIQKWKNSDGHRRMMKCPSTSHVGFNVYYANGTYYYTICYDFVGCNQMING